MEAADKNISIEKYIYSLLYLAVIGSTLVSVISFIVDLNANRHRPIVDMLILEMAILPWVFLVEFPVFAPPLCFQVGIAVCLAKKFGNAANYLALLALPVIAIVTFYSFAFVAAFFQPVQRALHSVGYGLELTAVRYWTAIAFQAPASLFAAVYARSDPDWSRWKILLLSAYAIVALWGVALNILLAMGGW